MPNDDRAVRLTISMETILRLLAVVIVVWFLYGIRSVLVVLLVSIILSSAIDPWVSGMQRRGIPRAAAILLIFIIAFGVISIVLALFVPALVTEVRDVAQSLPQLYDQLSQNAALDQFISQPQIVEAIRNSLESVDQALVKITGPIFSGLSSAVGGLISFIGIVVLTFYLALEENGIRTFLAAVVPARYQPYLSRLTNRVQGRMGQWLRGQLLLSLIIGSLSFLALWVLGVKYALLLALIAGLTELVPIAGPIIGAIPAIFFALTDSPLKALAVVIVYVIIQQLENNLIVPRVMQKATGLNPVVVILVMLIGAKLAGIAGVILAVPVTLIASAFLQDFLEERAEDNATLAER